MYIVQVIKMFVPNFANIKYSPVKTFQWQVIYLIYKEEIQFYYIDPSKIFSVLISSGHFSQKIGFKILF
jgi:hypothetical protein